MARFYGDLTGQAKTTATRRGSAKSGVRAHVRGWENGVRVEIAAKDVDGVEHDIISVYATSGSNGKGKDYLIAEFDGHGWEYFEG